MSGPKYGGCFVRTEGVERTALVAIASAAMKRPLAEFYAPELRWMIAGATYGGATWVTLELDASDFENTPSLDDNYTFWLTHGVEIVTAIAKSLRAPGAAFEHDNGTSFHIATTLVDRSGSVIASHDAGDETPIPEHVRIAEQKLEEAQLQDDSAFDEESPTMEYLRSIVYRPLEAHLGWTEGTLHGEHWDVYGDFPTEFMEASQRFKLPLA